MFLTFCHDNEVSARLDGSYSGTKHSFCFVNCPECHNEFKIKCSLLVNRIGYFVSKNQRPVIVCGNCRNIRLMKKAGETKDLNYWLRVVPCEALSIRYHSGFVNGSQPAEFQCVRCGSIFRQSFSRLKFLREKTETKVPCPVCSHGKFEQVQQIRNKCNEFGITILQGLDIRIPPQEDYVLYRTSCGHVYLATRYRLIQKVKSLCQYNNGCELCHGSVSQRIAYDMLLTYDNESICEYAVRYCGRKLEFDMFSRKFNCIIEVDGGMHTTSPARKHMDQLKETFCKEHNIHLHRIALDEKAQINQAHVDYIQADVQLFVAGLSK